MSRQVRPFPGSGSGGGAGITSPAVGATTIAGTAQPNAAVPVYKGTSTTPVGTAFADASGNWSLTLGTATALNDVYRTVGAGIVVGIVLTTLGVSNASATVGSAFSATVSGQTSGSTLSLSGPGAAGLSISGSTISGTPTTAGAVNIVETNAGATNSPNTTSGAITVAAASVGLGPTTLTITAGSTTPIPITGLASGQTVTSASGGWTVSGNSIVPPAGTVAGSLSVTVQTTVGPLTIAVTVGALSALGPTSATYIASAAAGTTVANITGLQPGEAVTSVLLGNGTDNGYLAITNGGARLVIGFTASVVGTIAYTVNTNQGRSFTFTATAQGVALPTLPSNPLVGGLGASRVRQSGQGYSNGNAYGMSTGTVSWLRAIEPRLRFVSWGDTTTEANTPTYMNGTIFASDGESFPQMRRRLPKLLASDVNIIMIDSPSGGVQDTNDDGTPFSVAAYTAQLKAIALAILAGGKLPMITTLVERISSTGGPWGIYPGTVRRLVPAINAEMTSWCASLGLPYADIRADIMGPNPAADPEPTRFPGDAYATTRDGTHWSSIGGYLTAKRVKDALAPYIPTSGPSDLAKTGTSLIANKDNAGTGGVVPGGTVTGTMPDGLTLLRETAGTGTTQVSTVAISRVTENGRPGVKFTIDTTAMPAGTNREGITIRPTVLPTFAAGLWYQGRVKAKVNAFDGWLNVAGMQMTPPTGSQVMGLAAADGGLTPVTSLAAAVGATRRDTMPFPTEAYSISNETFATKSLSAGTAVNTYFQAFWKKGTGSQIAEFTFWDFDVVEINDPTLLMYDETDTVAATITSAATASFLEEAPLLFAATANKRVKWSLATGDAGLFSIDVNGNITMLTTPDFETPLGAGTNSYSFNLIAQPFNPNVAPTTQAVTFSITDINDGFTDPMKAADWPNDTPVETNTNWTLDKTIATTGDAVVLYKGTATPAPSGGLRVASASQAWFLAPQQGDTVEQQCTPQMGLSGNTSASFYPLYKDKNNYLGITTYSTVTGIQIFAVINNVYTQIMRFTPYQVDLTNSKIKMQVRQTTSGVFMFEVFQNDVKLPLFSGNDNVTSFVGSGGPLAVARRSGFAARGAGTTILMRSWNNRVAAPIVSKFALYPITLATTTGSVGVDFASTLVGYLEGSTRQVTATPTVPAGYTGTIIADGTVLRAYDLIAGTYTVTITETDPRAVNSGRTSNVTFTIS